MKILSPVLVPKSEVQPFYLPPSFDLNVDYTIVKENGGQVVRGRRIVRGRRTTLTNTQTPS